MDDVSATDAASPEASEPPSANHKRTWLIVFVVVSTLLICSCILTVFLVLTGIIAEPETVIEQIVRTLLGS